MTPGPGSLPEAYFDVMRRYVMEQTRLRGFEVPADLQPRFVDHVSKHRRPMEFPPITTGMRWGMRLPKKLLLTRASTNGSAGLTR